ncbi:MAG: hypothetical protein QHH43_06775 [Candidatus Saccharicenans sp.]|jgi:hypothetical protein|nr:hypothetical protein [Candidatus Saccharicenans sp.]MDH7575445.1 hypothetical protein [Candidatus Saccharicenans sp.]
MKRFEKRLQELARTDPELQNPIAREHCPSPEDLSFSFEPDCPPELKISIINHVSGCPACRREFELLRGSRQLIGRLQEKFTSPRSRFIDRRISFFGLALPWWKMASALVTLLAIISIFYLGFNHLNSLKEERKIATAEQVILYEEVSWPQPAAIRLGWKSARDGLFYRVEVYDQNMYLLWQSPLISENRLELPDSVLDSLKDYQHFFWQLLIYSGQNKVMESEVRKVRLVSQ